MTNQTRKYIWPVSLAMSLALVGVLVAFVAMAGPQTAQAHGPCNFDDGIEAFVDCVATGGDEEHPPHEGTPQPLDMPANLSADDQTVTSITVSWDAVDGASGYRVEYMGPSHTAYQVYAGALQATSATISGLEPGTLYSIKVTALGVTDESLDSEAAMLQANTDPVAYDLNLSTSSPHAVVSTVTTATGDAMSVVTIQRPDVSVLVNAEVETDSPRDTTSVSVRIESADDTMYLDEDPGITYTTGSSLRGVGPRSIDDGIMDIQIRDAASRVFTLDVTCDADNVASLRGVLDIEIRDDTAAEVVAATILCEPPLEVAPPTERSSACYAISGMPDRIGDDPDTTDVVEYSDVELYTTDKSVQLTVTSYEKAYTITTQNNVETVTETACPHWPQPSVFIRLVDTPGVLPGMPEVDDEGGFVDTNGFIDEHGEVVGVSSGGELMLDIEATRGISLNATETRQVGVREGTFRVFTPADAEIGDQYYVELYDSRDTERIEHLHRDPFRAGLYDRTLNWVGYYDGLTTVSQEYERVVYVSPPVPGVNELQVTFDTGETATANVRWEEIAGAVKYTVAVIDTSNPNMYTLHGAAVKAANVARHHEFTGLVNGRKYIFAVYAELSNGTYSQLRVFIATPEFVASPSS